MRLFFTIIFTIYSLTLSAQSPKHKGLNSISVKSAKEHINFLASDMVEGREAGTKGATMASEYIVSQLKLIGVEPLFDDYYQNFETVLNVQKKRFSSDKEVVKMAKDSSHKIINMRNVLGKIEGKNPNEYVIVGAHFDHLGIDTTLVGDQIYNGADDNASGVSAVIQIAKAFKVSGVKPERTIVFAFWDGEEKGLLGSFYFVKYFDNIGRVKAYLNFDMIGRDHNNRKKHVEFFYTKANVEFEEWLKEDIKRYSLALKPTYRGWESPTGGSDNTHFAEKLIPILWYHTNTHSDYHKPSDHADKINWRKLNDITKAAFLNMWNLAN